MAQAETQKGTKVMKQHFITIFTIELVVIEPIDETLQRIVGYKKSKLATTISRIEELRNRVPSAAVAAQQAALDRLREAFVNAQQHSAAVDIPVASDCSAQLKALSKVLESSFTRLRVLEEKLQGDVARAERTAVAARQTQSHSAVDEIMREIAAAAGPAYGPTRVTRSRLAAHFRAKGLF